MAGNSGRTPATTNVSLTRWSHQLWLRQPNCAPVRLKNGAIQALWAYEGYFDATVAYRPALDWWIYDATIGEIYEWEWHHRRG